jgi:DNA-3-methyladenine glycosylase II
MTEQELLDGSAILAARDPDLARALERLGPPPLWNREPGFPTLVHIILEQQVSLASARAAFDKLVSRISPLEPTSLLELDDRELKAIGFSGQKGRYCRELARAVLDSSLDPDALVSLTDDQVRTELTKVTGIGRWTADIYLLMALGRPDVWPRGDLALHKAVRDLKVLEGHLTPSEFEELGEPWRPWRSVAARILWNHYLNPPLSGPTPRHRPTRRNP